MSKIQEALEKIKASQEEVSKPSILLENKSIDHIQDMIEPNILTPEIKARSKIVDNLMSDRKAFNAFRDLRTSVLESAHTSSPIIMVTSCIQGGGGSYIARNLAAAIALEDEKTSLLIDCNLHNSGDIDLISTDITKGLKDYLAGASCNINDIIHPSGIPKMRIIPTGTLDIPMAEYFTSTRLRQLFMEVKNRYSNRYIIVDTPPIEENADARILAQVCDYVILVVPYGKVTEDKIVSTARAIGQEKLLGIVFNNQPRSPRLSW